MKAVPEQFVFGSVVGQERYLGPDRTMGGGSLLDDLVDRLDDGPRRLRWHHRQRLHERLDLGGDVWRPVHARTIQSAGYLVKWGGSWPRSRRSLHRSVRRSVRRSLHRSVRRSLHRSVRRPSAWRTRSRTWRPAGSPLRSSDMCSRTGSHIPCRISHRRGSRSRSSSRSRGLVSRPDHCHGQRIAEPAQPATSAGRRPHSQPRRRK